MKRFTYAIVLAIPIFSGCTHIQDLIACQPPIRPPELLNEHVGWDHRTVDDVRCSNAELRAVQQARARNALKI